MNLESGFILVHKPKDITSSSAVLKTKKLIHKKKIGHTGTLDKFAEGLLILPFGFCTSFSSLFLEMEKTYTSEIKFGMATDSGDIDGVIVEEWDARRTSEFFQRNLEKITEKIKEIQTTTSQVPPKVSALKIKGVRQAELFRRGIEFESTSRNIFIRDFSFANLSDEGFLMSLTVSSGTYIRKLILDLYENTGLPMHITRLIRTKIGGTELADSSTIEAMENGEFSVKQLEEILEIPSIQIGRKEELSVSHGGYIRLPGNLESRYGFLLKNEDKKIIAWCSMSGKKEHLPYKYNKVFADSTF
ncbi:MAG: tRNA pseudouridine(55) synthase TruB [Leptospiraceae bacterium]|nr:tRNA pseudouridine(55) synthase TruB [Leptospiraceae bacterium]